MLNKFYIVVASAALLYYAADGVFGWEYGNPQRMTVASDARRSPGWSRTGPSHIWYTGFRGGK